MLLIPFKNGRSIINLGTFNRNESMSSLPSGPIEHQIDDHCAVGAVKGVRPE